MNRLRIILGLLLAGLFAHSANSQVATREAPIYTGSLAGGSQAYTVTPKPTGFALVDGAIIHAQINVANTGAATLNANGTGATQIKAQTDSGGTVALVGGEMVAGSTADFRYQTSCSCFTLTVYAGSAISTDVSGHTVSLAEWDFAHIFSFDTSGITLTLPSAATLAINGGIVIHTVGVTVSLAPQTGDAINFGQLGGGAQGAAITIPADTLAFVRSSGVAGNTAFTVPLGPVQYLPLSWGAGVNLSTPTAGVSIGRFATPRTIVEIKCRPDVVVGGAATIDVYAAASATQLSSGTKLNTTSCNANTGATTEQDMGVASVTVPAGYWIGVVATGAGWSSSSGWGAVQVSYR